MELSLTASRGDRVVPSRYMDATASSRAATTSVLAARKPTATAQKKSSSSVRRTSTHLNKKPATPTASTAKQRIVTSNSSNSRVTSGGLVKSSRPPVQTSLVVKATTAYELEMASQLYPWIFMRHTLTESSNIAVAEFQAKFAARVQELEAEEEVLTNDRIRYQTKRETQLLDELSPPHLCRVVPTLIRTFVLSQEGCQIAIVNATRLQGTDWKTACAVRSNIRDLDQLTGESIELRKSTTALLCTLSPDSLLGSTLEDLLPVLDMRLENLALSKKLLTTIQDNVKKLEHLESLIG